MKKSTLLLLVCLNVFFPALYAQRSYIGFHMTASEYIGDWNSNHYDIYKFKYFTPGAGISLQQYLNASFDVMEMATYNRVQYQTEDKVNGVDANFLTLNVNLKYKFNNGYFLKKDAGVAPYLIAGLGITNINSKQFTNTSSNDKEISKNEVKANLALGAGIHFRFNHVIGLDLAGTFNRPFYDGWDGYTKGGNDVYLQHSVGIVFNLTKQPDGDKDGVKDKNDLCPLTPPGVAVDPKGCPIDGDVDGVPDYLDKCPQLPGKTELNGCPDTDGDGVADIDDKCPAVPGIAKFAGCADSDNDGVEDDADKCPNTKTGTPVDATGCPLDADGDNVNDNVDKCPNTPAGTVVDSVGCPADSDKDGVLDNVDRCPHTAGDSTNAGCPVVTEAVKKRLNFATRGIYFETGKATLKPESYPMLNEIVSIINEYPDYNLKLLGHTDAVGAADRNMVLSQGRVNAVKDYLVSKGITASRLEAIGYGESKPIASNKTAAGKSKNRRVELELFLR